MIKPALALSHDTSLSCLQLPGSGHDFSEDVTINAGVVMPISWKINESLHLGLLLGAFAAVLFASFGMSRVTWSPVSINQEGISFSVVSPLLREEENVDIRVGCSECGIIQSIRLIDHSDKAKDAVQTGSELKSEQYAPDIAEISVRMQDGIIHKFRDENPANWRSGERVIIIAGHGKSDN